MNRVADSAEESGSSGATGGETGTSTVGLLGGAPKSAAKSAEKGANFLRTDSLSRAEVLQRAATSPPPPRPTERMYKAFLLEPPGKIPPGLFVAKDDPKIFRHLPPLSEATSSPNYMELLQRKVCACRDVVFDFRTNLYVEEREAKKATLGEILEYVNEPRKGSAEMIGEHIVRMVSSNAFRPLPPPASGSAVFMSNTGQDYIEEKEPNLDCSWPHLSLVYEIFLRFIMSSEVSPKTAKRFIDHTLVLQLLDLFASEDPRERDYLKTIMHRVYGKVMFLRAFIRKAIQQCFFRHIHENCSQPGVAELLEILGSIINGFAQPLKDEHKIFLRRAMIPLHKAKQVLHFHQQLTYCMTQ